MLSCSVKSQKILNNSWYYDKRVRCVRKRTSVSVGSPGFYSYQQGAMFSWVNPDIGSAQQWCWFPSASFSSCLVSKPRRLLLAGRGSWPVCFGGGERLKVTLATRAGGFRGIGRGDVQRLKLVFKSKGSSSAMTDGGQCFHDWQTGSVKNKKRDKQRKEP